MALCLYRLCKNKANDLTILFVFLYTSILAAQAVYIVGSGGDNFTEGNYGFLILFLLALLSQGVRWAFIRATKRGKNSGTRLFVQCAVLSLLVLYCGYCGLKDAALLRANAAGRKSEQYLPELGGTTPVAEDLREMQQIVEGHTLFSTFASALDDMLDNFQPTGCDYIFHALGERQFDAYLETFCENQYDFVQTTHYNSWPWEIWVNEVSWPFYRELYSNYTLHSDHAWWTLWQYAGEDVNVLPGTAEVTVEPMDGQNVCISVSAEVDETCFADVVVNWENRYTDDWRRFFTWQHAVLVYDDSMVNVRHGPSSSYLLPAEAQEHHLSVYLEHGKGSIILSGQPDYCTSLNVTEAYCDELIRFVR